MSIEDTTITGSENSFVTQQRDRDLFGASADEVTRLRNERSVMLKDVEKYRGRSPTFYSEVRYNSDTNDYETITQDEQYIDCLSLI